MESKPGGKYLKPKWNYSTKDLIWRIDFSPGNIIGECRSQVNKTTYYFCLDAQSGQPVWQDYRCDESWWIGIETVYEGYLIIHGYRRPDMPEHKGIRLVSLATGKQAWYNDELTYWFAANDSIYAYKYLFENRVGYKLDLKTGSIIEEYIQNLETLHELYRKVLEQKNEYDLHITTPELFDPTQNGLSLKNVIDEITGKEALAGWIEYVVKSEMLIISYYTQNRNGLINIIAIYDLKNKIVLYKSTVADNIQAPSPDTFFIVDDYLYFIKDSNTIIAMTPWKS